MYIVYNRLLYYVQDKIHGSQYGYSKTRYTEDALFRFVDESTRALATKVVDKLPSGKEILQTTKVPSNTIRPDCSIRQSRPCNTTTQTDAHESTHIPYTMD